MGEYVKENASLLIRSFQENERLEKAECLGLASEKKVADLNFSIRNTAWTTFLFSAEKFNLLTFNELPHLEKEMTTFI